jgi:hypothetical protein
MPLASAWQVGSGLFILTYLSLKVLLFLRTVTADMRRLNLSTASAYPERPWNDLPKPGHLIHRLVSSYNVSQWRYKFGPSGYKFQRQLSLSVREFDITSLKSHEPIIPLPYRPNGGMSRNRARGRRSKHDGRLVLYPIVSFYNRQANI